MNTIQTSRAHFTFKERVGHLELIWSRIKYIRTMCLLLLKIVE